MHGSIMRPGVAPIVIGATLLLGSLPVATAPNLPTATAPGFAQETAPESNFSIFGLVETPGRYRWLVGTTVGRAIAAAGGYADGGSPTNCRSSASSTGVSSRARSPRTIRCSRTT